MLFGEDSEDSGKNNLVGMFTFAKTFNTQEIAVLAGDCCVPVLAYHHLCCAHLPREFILNFFPEYQLPSGFGYTSVEDLAASFEVSRLYWNFERMTDKPELNLHRRQIMKR